MLIVCKVLDPPTPSLLLYLLQFFILMKFKPAGVLNGAAFA